MFDKDFELTRLGKRVMLSLVFLYSLCLIVLCWSPQNWEIVAVQTPNIFRVGRLVFLLVPFNSFLSLGELDTAWELFWVIGQNVANIFLLFPLIFSLLVLFSKWREFKWIIKVSFFISLTIEVGQLVLDFLIDANRVFEIDDLWTNTLGGYLAFISYKLLSEFLKGQNV